VVPARGGSGAPAKTSRSVVGSRMGERLWALLCRCWRRSWWGNVSAQHGSHHPGNHPTISGLRSEPPSRLPLSRKPRNRGISRWRRPYVRPAGGPVDTDFGALRMPTRGPTRRSEQARPSQGCALSSGPRSATPTRWSIQRHLSARDGEHRANSRRGGPTTSSIGAAAASKASAKGSWLTQVVALEVRSSPMAG
jgi:hypothetical protein